MPAASAWRSRLAVTSRSPILMLPPLIV